MLKSRTENSMSSAYKMFDKLSETLGAYSGGAIPWADLTRLEEIKPNTPTLFHSAQYMEDGKKKTVIVALVEQNNI